MTNTALNPVVKTYQNSGSSALCDVCLIIISLSNLSVGLGIARPYSNKNPIASAELSKTEFDLATLNACGTYQSVTWLYTYIKPALQLTVYVHKASLATLSPTQLPHMRTFFWVWAVGRFFKKRWILTARFSGAHSGFENWFVINIARIYTCIFFNVPWAGTNAFCLPHI